MYARPSKFPFDRQNFLVEFWRFDEDFCFFERIIHYHMNLHAFVIAQKEKETTSPVYVVHYLN